MPPKCQPTLQLLTAAATAGPAGLTSLTALLDQAGLEISIVPKTPAPQQQQQQGGAFPGSLQLSNNLMSSGSGALMGAVAAPDEFAAAAAAHANPAGHRHMASLMAMLPASPTAAANRAFDTSTTPFSAAAGAAAAAAAAAAAGGLKYRSTGKPLGSRGSGGFSKMPSDYAAWNDKSNPVNPGGLTFCRGGSKARRGWMPGSSAGTGQFAAAAGGPPAADAASAVQPLLAKLGALLGGNHRLSAAALGIGGFAGGQALETQLAAGLGQQQQQLLRLPQLLPKQELTHQQQQQEEAGEEGEQQMQGSQGDQVHALVAKLLQAVQGAGPGAAAANATGRQGMLLQQQQQQQQVVVQHAAAAAAGDDEVAAAGEPPAKRHKQHSTQLQTAGASSFSRSSSSNTSGNGNSRQHTPGAMIAEPSPFMHAAAAGAAAGLTGLVGGVLEPSGSAEEGLEPGDGDELMQDHPSCKEWHPPRTAAPAAAAAPVQTVQQALAAVLAANRSAADASAGAAAAAGVPSSGGNAPNLDIAALLQLVQGQLGMHGEQQAAPATAPNVGTPIAPAAAGNAAVTAGPTGMEIDHAVQQQQGGVTNMLVTQQQTPAALAPPAAAAAAAGDEGAAVGGTTRLPPLGRALQRLLLRRAGQQDSRGQAQVLQQLIGEVQQELRDIASTQQQQQEGARRSRSNSEGAAAPAASPPAAAAGSQPAAAGGAAAALLGKPVEQHVADLFAGAGAGGGTGGAAANGRTVTTGAAGLLSDVQQAVQLQRGTGGWGTGRTVTSDPEGTAVAPHMLAPAEQQQQQQRGGCASRSGGLPAAAAEAVHGVKQTAEGGGDAAAAAAAAAGGSSSTGIAGEGGQHGDVTVGMPVTVKDEQEGMA
jgi:hypothetical protein